MKCLAKNKISFSYTLQQVNKGDKNKYGKARQKTVVKEKREGGIYCVKHETMKAAKTKKQSKLKINFASDFMH